MASISYSWGTLDAMTREEVRGRIEEIGIIPALRVPSAEEALFAAHAVLRGGIGVLEMTMTIPGAFEAIAELTRTSPHLMVGAGTVLDLDTASRCLDAGAAFLTSPSLDLEIVAFGATRNALVIPGALTPTEVAAASKAGADLVKIFPCAQLGGSGYIKALKAPFPHVALMASGGVNQQTASDFIRAGAVVLGIGENLIPPDAVRGKKEKWIHELCVRFLAVIKEARALL
jgi:2-dehydro-3-deoxyphosphogluconate aldolase / (4S)-4-hydroxy-2-oxoglutarate aldolase